MGFSAFAWHGIASAGAALQECGLKGGFVEMDGERCIIGAGFLGGG